MRSSSLLALLCLATSTFAQFNTDHLVDSLKKDPRYIIEDSILIPTTDGASVSAWMMRSRINNTPLPTILQFTIYARQADILKMQKAVDRGYVGVMAYSRGKRYGSGEVMPYQYDAVDVYQVIDWISKQEWSDQRVGMMGGSYNGFTQWAATKKLHPALKTIVPSASVAPGLDVPMTNNVVMSFVFPWTYYVSNNKFLDEEDYRGRQWRDLYFDWYWKGTAYRTLDTLLGRPGNKIFQRWLQHPSYDKYWQSMIPYKEEFAGIDIPVLSTTGYFDGGQIGATYYYREHLKYRPNAEHYLLIGPYGHFGSQGHPDSVYGGYHLEPTAIQPIHEIIYEWFDYIFWKKPKPSILKDRVNFQVMGTDKWKHVSTLDQLSNKEMILYPVASGKALEGKLSSRPGKNYIEQVVDFKDRETINSYFYFDQIVRDSLFTNHGVVLESDQLEKDMELNGCFSGLMNVMINKRDMDFSVVLMEKTADGKYFFLSYFMGRASYAKDLRRKQLLKPGKKESLPFVNSYMTSKLLRKGSRVVVILNVNKSPFEQINYGTGRDVNGETINDAAEPLRVRWFGDSRLVLPGWKP